MLCVIFWFIGYFKFIVFESNLLTDSMLCAMFWFIKHQRFRRFESRKPADTGWVKNFRI